MENIYTLEKNYIKIQKMILKQHYFNENDLDPQ